MLTSQLVLQRAVAAAAGARLTLRPHPSQHQPARLAASSSSSSRHRAVAMSAAGPMASEMEKKLTEQLRPSRLEIVNESHMHAGHSGNPGGGPDAETHFRVTVVSDAFEGKSLVARHRLVYGLLDDEMRRAGGVHALALTTKTPAEMAKAGGS
eukprot:jgi/Chlat1/2063/Chrsp17S02531